MDRPAYIEDDYDYSRNTPNRNYAPDPSKLEVKRVSADPKKELTPEELEKEKKKKPLKTLLVFILSNFGIILVVLAYICGGAYLFQILEQHQEIQNCQSGEGELTNIIQDTRTELFNYIFFNTSSDADTANATGRYGPSVYNPQIQTWLYNFSTYVMSVSSKYGYTGQDCETQSMWQYMSAMLFTFTVVSTIGYGHVTPKTWEGRIVCICYATLGIPLFLMSLARISGIMSELYRFLYSRVLCYPCLNYANGKKKDEEDDDEEIVKHEEHEEAEQQEANNLDHFDGTKESKERVVEDEEDDMVGDEVADRVSVPLVFVVGTFGAYMAIGMLIFVNRESWEYVSALYFCYVSLSTMGFGDLVPGMTAISNNKQDEATVNLLIAFVYLFIGMALLAMCFALMQDEFKEKVELIVTKLGIRKNQEEEEEDDDDSDEEDDYGAVGVVAAGGTAAGVGMAGAYGAYQGRDVDSARSSLPPHYENSALDLRFERDPTVISVKPTMDSYEEEDLDFMPVTDRNMTQREPSHRDRQPSGGYPVREPTRESLNQREKSSHFMREKSALAFNREVTKLYQQKAENERQMSGGNSRGFSNHAYDSNADYFGDL